jgi:flagellar biosynthesis protein FlhG
MARDHKVLAVDLDRGCGNLNASLGVRSVTQSIEDFISARVKDLAPIKARTVVDNLQLISCSYAPVNNTSLNETQKKKLLDHLRSDESDYVLIDLGAGVAQDTVELFAAADLKVVVTQPESLALHNAFVFLKSVAYRVIERDLERTKLSKRHRQEITDQLYSGSSQEIDQIISRIGKHNLDAAALIEGSLRSLNTGVILNKVQDPVEEKFVASLQRLAKKYADIDLAFWGSIPFDLNVKKSLNDVVPFALEYSSSPANAAFLELTRGMDKCIASLSDESDDAAGPESSRVRRKFAFWGNKTTAQSPLGLSAPDVPSLNHSNKDETTSRLQSQLAEKAVQFEREKQDWIKECEDRDRRLQELTKIVQQSDSIIASLKKADEARIQESQKLLREKEEIIRDLEAKLKVTLTELEALRWRDGFRVSRSAPSPAKQRLTELEKLNRRIDQPAWSVNPKLGSNHSEAEFQSRGSGDNYETAGPDYFGKPATNIAEQITANLCVYSPQTITVVCMEEGLVEAASFAKELAAAISSAQWSVTSTSRSFKNNPFTGLRIVYDHSEDAVQGARNLALALADAGIACSLQRSSFPPHVDKIHLVVGLNESGHLRIPRTLEKIQARAAVAQTALNE